MTHASERFATPLQMRVLGVEQSYCLRVSEPEPGRVLVEQDIQLC
ncbi:MAG TPA: hypothetical protein VF844_11260 [Ktedonobacteraceae bacterium]